MQISGSTLLLSTNQNIINITPYSIIDKSEFNMRILGFLLLLSTTIANAQNSPDRTTFIKTYGEQGKSRGVTVEQTSDGGYIITGYTTAGDYGAEDVLLIKTDDKGEIVWQKTYGGSGEDSGWAVRQCADGGYIVSGFTESFGEGGMDVYLIRTDVNGEALWAKTFGGSGDEYGWDIQITDDNSFIIASQSNSKESGNIDAQLIKVDNKGNLIWSKTYGGAQIDRVFSVQQNQDGTYLAAGISYSYTSVNSNDRDGYLIKVDALGNKLWHKTYGGDKYDVVHALSSTKDQGHILVGYGESLAENGRMDVYLIKNDENAETQWTKAYGEADGERGIKVAQTRDDGFVAIGFTEKDLNLYLVKTDKNGSKQWSRSYGRPDKLDFGYTVKPTVDGGYILVGHTEDRSNGQSSVLLIKTNALGLTE